MLPTGHIAAGYLVAEAVLKILKPDLPIEQFNQLLFLGAFFGFCPDLDMFYAFAKAKGFTLPDKKINHRFYLTHRPMFWLALSVLIFWLAYGFEFTSTYFQMFAVIMLLGTWSHFVLDSFKVGVMWFWPFTNQYFALRSPGEREEGPKTSFMGFWLWFLKYYPTHNPVTFYLELLVLLTASTVFYWLHLS